MKEKKVLIINTGGTIGMVRTENGFAPKAGALKSELSHIKDLTSPDMPSWELIEFDPLLDSSNIRCEHWNKIAKTIESNYYDYDGFVILHGTDTLAYSASALSFMLEGLAKPVILTGSQIPLCELRSDGKDNLITSLIIAAQGIAREVCLYFGGALLRGNRAVKESADSIMAFTSPNYPKLAKAGIDIEYRDKILLTPAEGSILHVAEMKESKLGVIKVFPGMQFEIFAPVIKDALDGLILETFGTGNIPSYDHALTDLISDACSRGAIVVVCTQCAEGTVRLGAYEAGSALVKAGALSGHNMTTEATVTKLSYLLSKDLPREEIKRLMGCSLRGEF